MAKHNIAALFGQVISTNIVKHDDGSYRSGVMMLNVVRGQRDTGNKQIALTFDFPWIASLDPSIIKRMEEFKPNDIVYIKGVFTTIDVQKETYCPKCGKATERKGTKVHITPIHILKIKDNLLKDEALDFLKENCEISNSVMVVGKLTENPHSFKTQSGIMRTNYILQVGRKYRIKDDAIQTKNDFPMIRSYGRAAESNAKALIENSLVLINGCLQTRQYDKKMQCVHCGEHYTSKDYTMEIVPYDVEYLSGYRTKEEIEKYENEPSIEILPDTDIDRTDIQNSVGSNNPINYIEFNE